MVTAVTAALLPDAGGLTTDFLYDQAGTGEGYRLQVIALQEFINRTWSANGQ